MNGLDMNKLLKYQLDKKGSKFNLSPLLVLFFLSISVLIPACPADGFEGQVKLAWDPVESAAGYVAYWGTSSRDYAESTDVGQATTFEIPGLQEGQVYYFAVTAYNADHNESVYSEELMHLVALRDTDGDGVPDTEEINIYHTNPGKRDSDGDAMNDEWEIDYGTDPLVDDADGDLNRNGISNLEEFFRQTQTDNQRPGKPVLTEPGDGSANVALVSVLRSDFFTDPDAGDFHTETRWQVSGNTEFSDLVLDLQSATFLTQLPLLDYILEPDRTYWWRVRYFDDHAAASEWSATSSFMTVLSADDDLDGDGVPDAQEVGFEVDLDENGVPDQSQDEIKSALTSAGDALVSLKSPPAEGFIETFKTSVSNPNDSSSAMGLQFPMGLVHFKLAVPNPGDTATVVIYFSEALPEGLAWYKYTPAKGWHSYAEHATIAADGKSVTVELQDGGFGDADGVVNGMIVDPSGVGYVTVANTTSPTAVVSSGEGGGGTGGGGGGCFIGTAGSMIQGAVWHYLHGIVDSCVNAVKETVMLLRDRLTPGKTLLK